jgi:hypothetical protein
MVSPSFEEWVIGPSDLQVRQALAEGLRLHPITAAVLVARGVRSRDDAAAVLLDEGALRLQIKSWNGIGGVQLRVKDLWSSPYGEVAIC